MSEYYQRPGTNDKRFDDEMRRAMLKACNKHNLEKGLMVLYLRQQEILNLLRKMDTDNKNKWPIPYGMSADTSREDDFQAFTFLFKRPNSQSDIKEDTQK